MDVSEIAYVLYSHIYLGTHTYDKERKETVNDLETPLYIVGLRQPTY